MQKLNIENYGLAILAAGGSSRLGSPKQLLKYKGKALLQHAIDSARETDAEEILIVLGSDKELIADQINHHAIQSVANPNWRSGMGSSIKLGVMELMVISPDIDAILLMVCDQPFADATVLKSLLTKQKETGAAIVACRYENTQGIPALFHASLFPELLTVEGDMGAKNLFDKYKEVTSFVSFERGGIDIDTSEDYNNLVK